MSTNTPVVGGHEGDGQRGSTRNAVSRMLLVGGAVFAIVGFADLALLWYPAQPNNLAWEYATVGRTMDSMPMPALGLLLMSYGVLRSPGATRRSVAVIAATFALFGLLCAFVGFLLFTSAPAVISQSPPDAADAVRRAATRHGVQSLLYPLAWLSIAWIVWQARSVRAAP